MNSDGGSAGSREAGQTLAAERQRRGVTQEALARRMGVTAARVSAIESGNNRLRPETITRYMACLELITHGQVDAATLEMRLTVEQVQWLSLFSELTVEDQVEALTKAREWLAEKAGHRINEDKRQKSQPDQQA